MSQSKELPADLSDYYLEFPSPPHPSKREASALFLLIFAAYLALLAYRFDLQVDFNLHPPPHPEHNAAEVTITAPANASLFELGQTINDHFPILVSTDPESPIAKDQTLTVGVLTRLTPESYQQLFHETFPFPPNRNYLLFSTQTFSTADLGAPRGRISGGPITISVNRDGLDFISYVAGALGTSLNLDTSHTGDSEVFDIVFVQTEPDPASTTLPDSITLQPVATITKNHTEKPKITPAQNVPRDQQGNIIIAASTDKNSIFIGTKCNTSFVSSTNLGPLHFEVSGDFCGNFQVPLNITVVDACQVQKFITTLIVPPGLNGVNFFAHFPWDGIDPDRPHNHSATTLWPDFDNPDCTDYSVDISYPSSNITDSSTTIQLPYTSIQTTP